MKHAKKLSIFLLCISLMLSLSLPVLASDAETEAEEETTWVVSDDQMTLTGGDTVYVPFPRLVARNFIM